MYDVVVIGSGPAGYEVALLLTEGGKSVCLVEKSERNLGGTCLNEGCIPAKSFLESALYLKKQDYFQSCGINVQLKSLDIELLKHSTFSIVSELKNGILAKLKKAGVDIKYGTASFIDSNNIMINPQTQKIKADKFIIATGSNHREHPLMPLVDERIISSREVFAIDKVPSSILIVGGGAIGCEFASFYNALGTEVEISEYTSQLIPTEDIDVARTLKRELEKKGIKVHLNSEVLNHAVVGSHVEIDMRVGKKELTKNYEQVLISIGRVPNSSGLLLQNANISQERGFVVVDDNLRSINQENIYAIGDVISSPALAHVAYYEAKRVAREILSLDTLPSKYIFPSVIFCLPQVASIGASEVSLKESNVDYKSKKIFFKSNAKAKIKGDDSGFLKILVMADTQQILGASIIGNEATEMIHQFLIAIHRNTTISDLRSMIFAHPTLSEIISEL